MAKKKKRKSLRQNFLSGRKIEARELKKNLSIKKLVDGYFQSYNSARLSEACQLLTRKMLKSQNSATICLTMAGALTPAGMSGMIVSMMKAGFIDFIISTGANLYHDMHFALGLNLHKGVFNIDDATLWKNGIVRIYDTYLGADTLIRTDKFLDQITSFEKDAPRGAISSCELHHYIGRKLLAKAKNPEISILAQAAKLNIPIYTSSPGDSTLGMNMASYVPDGINLTIDPNLDVLETAAIVMCAKQNGAIILGGGSPKNFYMQTQPMLWECLGIERGGHDYFIQITMDSPQWGGLSGATPSEAVSWGKVNPNELQNTVVVYADVTIASPILFSYALSEANPRVQKKLYLRREEFMGQLKKEDKGLYWWPDYEKR
ncbi:MAG: deoxyhypusine synthase [Candidatus Portnoybacteria bacterium]|nr:deoxyhypusine synthase [Candidatus Portnoybacteria bacterium]MDD4982452.1 deoxyhypusine synthase [Candidatus Portnoybacteria bacterium]